MFIPRALLPIVPLFLFTLTTACDEPAGANDTEDTEDTEDAEDTTPAAVEVQGKVLLELELSATHNVKFIETAPGEVDIVELGHMDIDAERMAEIDGENLDGKSLADIYRGFQPDADAVPEILVDADRRIALAQQVRAREVAYELPPTAAPAEGSGPQQPSDDEVTMRSLNDTWDWPGDKLWFKSQFCQPGAGQSLSCITDYWQGTYSGSKSNTKYFRAVGLAAGFDSTAYFTKKTWQCEFLFFCDWDLDHAEILQPRTWSMVTSSSSTRNRQAAIDQSTDRVYLSTIWSTASSNPAPPPPPPEACNYYARAHAATCYNYDGTVSNIASNTMCADACGSTYNNAVTYATQALSVQTCLGAYAGCCVYHVDQNFNYCGG